MPVTCLDDFLDAVDGAGEERAHLLIIVHMVRVSDAHEDDVGEQARQLLDRHARLQI